MKKLHWLAVLMGITIAVITGFQVYWMQKNYEREQRTLEIKTNMAFRETIYGLQKSRLKLGKFNPDSSHAAQMRVMLDASPVKMREGGPPPTEDVITMVNVLRDKMKDSLREVSAVNGQMVVSLNKKSFYYQTDSAGVRGHSGRAGDPVFRFLYRVDSLQDSIRVKDVVQAYSKRLTEEKVNIPFTVLYSDTAIDDAIPKFNEVTVGFAKPVTYKLQLGNTFPYIIKKLLSPILFSLFLIGVTILSFTLLYRNLLAQQRLTTIKNDFISNITHELKTPIATVNVAIEALRNFGGLQSPERTKEYLDISASELQRLSLLVDKVLRLSMFENKEVPLQKESFDLLQVTQEVIGSMRLQFEKQKANTALEVSGENFTIEADKLHITSVIYNLLDNALKYSKENPDILVRLVAQPQYVELCVIDNGIGIASEYKGKIFDQFFRVPNGDRHNTKGYGLGLSYVRHIAKRHLGFIEVKSELDKGSTFTVKLPYA